MEVGIDQKDLPLRDVVETWLMACSIRSNEEVTEKLKKFGKVSSK